MKLKGKMDKGVSACMGRRRNLSLGKEVWSRLRFVLLFSHLQEGAEFLTADQLYCNVIIELEAFRRSRVVP